jgi:hypothetical protein
MCKVGLCTHPCVHIPHKSKHTIRIPPQRQKNISTNVDAVHFDFYTHTLSCFRMYNFLGECSNNSKRKTLQNVAMYFLKYFLLSSNNSISIQFISLLPSLPAKTLNFHLMNAKTGHVQLLPDSHNLFRSSDIS